ncbi:hypothetical protein NF556_18435 [Ornithinimicrobium faecis]|uniref:Lumazine-binding protein n=1 Tax=Ornithinimicrobium faecis TaxID=2934158 RepID=A0ABY4YT56_9MICO|nr:hypothetical protein [Ornithinimicrobium sp. HY1793]USQ79548.1 hypothetical protein NF556_18435 [Ornithinimicrobium sp. HY1793]
MRRALVTALAVPVLLLSACGSDEPEVEDATTEQTSEAEETTEEAPATEEPAEEETTDAAPTTEEPTEAVPTTEEPTEEAPVTEAPGDGGETTEAPGAGGEGEGGADGQAAADRTKEWLVAFVNAEESVCDMMLDLESTGPMVDNQAHYDICISTFPTQAEGMFGSTPEMAGIIESMEINGADVQGDTAVIDKDNFSPMFAEAFGDEIITLKKIDGEWLVDMNASFNG